MRLRYRAQALADIDAIDRFVGEHSGAGKTNTAVILRCSPSWASLEG
jgi:hypothetical protein